MNNEKEEKPLMFIDTVQEVNKNKNNQSVFDSRTNKDKKKG